MSDVLAALARHRGSAAAVGIQFPLVELMDDSRCITMSKDLCAAQPDGWTELRATATAYNMIPNEPGLYAFVWRPELRLEVAVGNQRETINTTQILYIGQAGGDGGGGTLRQRYKNEYAKLAGKDPNNPFTLQAGGDRRQRLKRLLNVHPLRYWYLVPSDRSEIAHLESRLIELLNPPVNQQGRLRHEGSKKAFL